MPVRLTDVYSVDELPGDLSVSLLAQTVHQWMHPYNDIPEDTEQGILDALNGRPAPGGFAICAYNSHELVGVLVMLRTGMSGYIPPNLLLFLAVCPAHRRKGIGKLLVCHALENCTGSVKLHVESDNPAMKLYQHLGFSPAYYDMRYRREEVPHQ